ncbi:MULTISPECIES: histidine phosphatase family protein [Aneurinibacillus]|uniref:Alpha-ribazole phosphatase n=1 Tax=Aneurinibacillus thermoaerophilus TaxID=143495 RepID=A0A1G8CMA2_ANETH|nr:MULTISPECIES: histidine phosphatase family protein [Aneurinibacillus]AMA71903.1 hypothetical protein ACH33_02980 [Aneurinibacillus sp. XH2]MED0675549.1 histidine phosphatase family protein [Aneurinibacillus thermoaerophilus]MED0680316.1 histidine phosphatase family protein [Aneurinibacillus thermoaerophilus]MED0737057.1 histidine phosphatase family protein [Aneurinibacillus thermoaerophilus]MED0757373.1 histidine phosphatase family protein [Aneurinibacillus thermoaerophilus]
MRWIWVRHGETQENRERRYLGHYDAPLTARGRRQAEVVAERLSGERIDFIYTSDLLRCRETAEVIARVHGLYPFVAKELRELDFGKWDRKTYEEIMQRDKQLAKEWYNDPYTITPPEGESLQELGKRVDRWLLALQERMHPREIAVLVSHGGPIRWFLATWIMETPACFWSVKNLGPGEFFIAEKCGQTWIARSL